MREINKCDISKNIISYLEPLSHITEAYRSACTNILYSNNNRDTMSIVITSPDIHEGKSVTASNLAVCFSNLNKKVLLIDADLRNPSIHKQFNMKDTVGLVNILKGDITLIDSIFKIIPIANLHILTTGTKTYNPYELLSSKEMPKIISEAIENFDIIIIDTPPVGYVSDTLVLSKYVDGVIITVAEKETNIKTTKKVINNFNNINANILGIIVTKTKAAGNYSKYYNYI